MQTLQPTAAFLSLSVESQALVIEQQKSNKRLAISNVRVAAYNYKRHVAYYGVIC